MFRLDMGLIIYFAFNLSFIWSFSGVFFWYVFLSFPLFAKVGKLKVPQPHTTSCGIYYNI
jgi:hypothetical protein